MKLMLDAAPQILRSTESPQFIVKRFMYYTGKIKGHGEKIVESSDHGESFAVEPGDVPRYQI